MVTVPVVVCEFFFVEVEVDLGFMASNVIAAIADVVADAVGGLVPVENCVCVVAGVMVCAGDVIGAVFVEVDIVDSFAVVVEVLVFEGIPVVVAFCAELVVWVELSFASFVTVVRTVVEAVEVAAALIIAGVIADGVVVATGVVIAPCVVDATGVVIADGVVVATGVVIAS